MSAPLGLWNRSFLTALIANFLTFMVTLSFVIYPLHIQAQGGDDTDIGVIMGAFFLCSMIARPFAGLLAERAGYKTVSLLGLAIIAATTPAFAFAPAVGAPPVALRVLMGLGWSCLMSPLMALATLATPSSRLSEALGHYGVSGLLASALAPPLAELVVSRHGYPALFACDAGIALVALALVASLPPVAPQDEAAPAGAAAGSRVAVAGLAGAFALILAHGAARGVNVNFIAPFAHTLGLSSISPFFAAFSLAALLTRFGLAWLSDRHGSRRIAIPAGLLVGANCLLVSQTRGMAMLVVAGLVSGFAQGLIFPALSALMVKLIGQRRRAFALSLYSMGFDMGFGLGLPLMGAIADRAGYRWMYGCMGLGVVAAVGLFALLLRKEPN